MQTKQAKAFFKNIYSRPTIVNNICKVIFFRFDLLVCVYLFSFLCEISIFVEMPVEEKKGDMFAVAEQPEYKDFALAHCISEDCK